MVITTQSTQMFNTISLAICFLFLLVLSSCTEEPEQITATAEIKVGCTGCHDVRPDADHAFACTQCHEGTDDTGSYEQAHQEMVRHPAHPDNAATYCGNCHESALEKVQKSSHYTLQNHVSLVREAFGATEAVDSALILNSSTDPQSAMLLIDDLLRRRCLRCHVYGEGDDFASVRRATGCGACHLEYADRKMASHEFLAKPGDSRCLSCHYGNHVGFDYYGRFEHDYNEEYRTPYTAVGVTPSPYGVEYHQLEADVHQQAGMICIDCHTQDEVMGSRKSPITCRGCHDPDNLASVAPLTIEKRDNIFVFSSTATDLSLPVPLLEHPAHFSPEPRTCQACHARWTYNDSQVHLLRIDHDDFDDFYKLSLDGSSEVKKIITSHNDEDGDLLEPFMTDKFNGEDFPGIWFKGFSERRWDQLNLVQDVDGTIRVGRPILDLRISWIDIDETARFDNLRPLPTINTLLPYAPHTIGSAGLFYEERLRQFAEQQNRSATPTVK